MLNNRSFKIYRLMDSIESGDGSFNKEYADTGYFINGFLDLASPEFAAIVDGAFGKTFRFYSMETDRDVQDGDRLINPADVNDFYEVKGAMKRGDLPGGNIELVLVKTIKQ